MLDYLKNNTIYKNKYKTHKDAIIVSCFFNPQNSKYRLKAFDIFYDKIKHLNHQIIECVIGDSKPQLNYPNIKTIHTKNLLWHKETLLNKVISELPQKYKYVFWIDADVIFTNNNWLVDGVEQLKTNNIIQPFKYCFHLDKDQIKSDKVVTDLNKKIWRSFCSNYVENKSWMDNDYDTHGHVGFAWGAKREILDTIPLYDKALIGGADHIIAHASANQINHCCISKAFIENIDEINIWSEKFAKLIDGKIGFVEGELYHIWHGDIEKRQYLKRIHNFSAHNKNITQKDINGFYITEDDSYVREYFSIREVSDDSTIIENVEKIITYSEHITKNDDVNIESTQYLYEQKEEIEFGGGDAGGSGSGGDWLNDNFS